MTHIEKISFFSSHHSGNFGAFSSNGTFPPLPPLPPSGCPDPTTDPNWPPQDASGNYVANDFSDDGFMQAITNDLTYISAHPADPSGYIELAKIIHRLSGLTQKDGTPLLSIVESRVDATKLTNLVKDGIDYASQFGFLYGYGGGSGGTTSDYAGFASALLGTLPPSSSDPFIQAMIDESNTIVTGANEFVNGNYATTPPEYGHVYDGVHPPHAVDAFGNTIAKGDIIYAYQESNGDGTFSTIFYDWTAARNAENGASTPQWATTTLQKIEGSIENSSGAAGGPNPDVDTLNQALNGLQVNDSLNTFMTVLKQTGDIGLAILAFIYEWEGYSMNESLAGPADVIDKEKQMSQWAKQIEDDLKEINSGSFSGAQASQIAANTLALFESINESGQFADGLGSAVASAINTFETTAIPFPAGSSTTKSLWSLFTGVASGTVKPSDFAAALTAALAPAPPSSSGSSGSSDSGSIALQGVLGGFDGIITAVSSNSSAEVTTSQQGEAKIQAMDKVMTGVTDKTTGMNTAVIQKTLQLPG